MLSNEQLQTLMAVARKVFNSGFVPKDCGSEDAVFAMMLMGVELGFEPMQSLAAVHSIKGKLSLKADAMVALCMKSPVCKHFVLVENTDKLATYEAMREGHPAPTRLTYRIEQAQRAGLLSNPQWKNHPEAMLRARCGGALARLMFPDLVAGIYIPDEAEEIAATDGPRVRQIAPEAPMRALPESSDAAVVAEAPALTAFLARVAACVTSGELVAVRLASRAALTTLLPDELDRAKGCVEARATDLFGNIDDYASAQAEAKALSQDPAHWATVAAALGAMGAAANAVALRAAASAHSSALSALPAPIKARVEAFYRRRKSALVHAADDRALAAELEALLHAADGIPALDDVAEKIETAAKAREITREQAAALVSRYNDLVAALEREPETGEAA